MEKIKKELSKKIADEMRKSSNLRQLSKDDNLSFDKARVLYKQSNDLGNKINFFRNLDKALKKKD